MVASRDSLGLRAICFRVVLGIEGYRESEAYDVDSLCGWHQSFLPVGHTAIPAGLSDH